MAFLAAACSPASLPAADAKLPVVATFSVLGDLVRNIGGDHVEVTLLVGPGQDTHTFQPNPANAAALADASMLFENGLGLETWLDDLYQASESRATRVVVTSIIDPIAGEGDEHAAGEEADPEHDQGKFDPHVWHSVSNVMQMAPPIAAALAQADPAHAADYQANADSYMAELQDLDTWIGSQVATIPEGNRKLVTSHDTFSYFAQSYGFEVVGSVLPASTEGASPSAQELAALVEQVRAQGVPAVFAENVTSNSLINQVASEAGVKLVASLYTDALGPAGSDGDTYLKMMRYNVTTITTALTQ